MRLSLLFVLPLTISAQEVTTFSTDVKVVTVLATVHNSKGQIVGNLNQDDFAVAEDGRKQAIRYFTRETNLPLTLGLLVDTSMSQRRVLADEERGSIAFFQQVLREDKDHAFVIHFDREVELLQDLTSSRQKLETAIGQIQAPQQLRRVRTAGQGPRQGGGTALYDSVLLAANEIMSKETGRKAVVILSDGVDNGSKVGISEAIEAAQRADLLVYAILFSDEQAYGSGSPPMGGRGMGGHGGRGGPMPQQRRNAPDGKKVLQQLATETGGSFFEVSKKLPLERTFAKIEEELRNQYNIGYNSDQPATSTAFRRIELTASGKGLVVKARPGYFPK